MKGIVKIHKRQADYLYADVKHCLQKAKIKLTFGLDIDLPAVPVKAEACTLPDQLPALFETELNPSISLVALSPNRMHLTTGLVFDLNEITIGSSISDKVLIIDHLAIQADTNSITLPAEDFIFSSASFDNDYQAQDKLNFGDEPLASLEHDDSDGWIRTFLNESVKSPENEPSHNEKIHVQSDELEPIHLVAMKGLQIKKKRKLVVDANPSIDKHEFMANVRCLQNTAKEPDRISLAARKKFKSAKVLYSAPADYVITTKSLLSLWMNGTNPSEIRKDAVLGDSLAYNRGNSSSLVATEVPRARNASTGNEESLIATDHSENYTLHDISSGSSDHFISTPDLRMSSQKSQHGTSLYLSPLKEEVDENHMEVIPDIELEAENSNILYENDRKGRQDSHNLSVFEYLKDLTQQMIRDKFTFDQLIPPHSSRLQASRQFYRLLALAKVKKIIIYQSKPYASIIVTVLDRQ
ncbi:hypothetical protein TrispH2_006223 [Trichoplax sp. H2]|nr:hypothetical protein TrispH2_006223 [Trichoplax sp. H2]|eukprot:RDD41642.1 hypothetical protein TrispH2_006223 [Trichoplax sp. H2]